MTIHCLDCASGCVCLADNGPWLEPAADSKCGHGQCPDCHRCICCCMHSEGVSVTALLPLAYFGGDLASAPDLLRPLARFGQFNVKQYENRRDTVAQLMIGLARVGTRCRQRRDWTGTRVLVVRDVVGGVGDKILMGQMLWALQRAGAELHGLLAAPVQTALSAEIERLYWPPLIAEDTERFMGEAALKRAGRFDSVTGIFKIPGEVCATYQSFSAAVEAQFALKGGCVVVPPAHTPQRRLDLPESYFLAHVGARTCRYADAPALALARRHAAENGKPLVVIGKREGTEHLEFGDAIDRRGAGPIADDIDIVAHATWGFGPDSAIAHIAGTLGVPFVAVVDTALPWLAGLGFQPNWWLAQYPKTVIVPLSVALEG